MSVATNDLFNVQAIGTCFGQRIMLTHWYFVTGVIGAITEAAASSDLLDELRAGGGGDAFETAYRACMPADWVLNRWRVQKVAPVRYRFYQTTRDVAGTHASTTETANQSAVITFSTLLAGRDQIANKHIGPIPQGASVQVNGELNGAYKTLLDTMAAGMNQVLTGGVTGISFNPCIAHKTPAGSFTAIVTYLTQDSIRVMRRRTLRVGE